MNREAMETWVAALENPANEKRQIKDRYQDDQGGVCALGLASEVWAEAGIRVDNTFAKPMFFVNTDRGTSLGVAALNDAGWSFWNIAQALRATHLKETT